MKKKVLLIWPNNEDTMFGLPLGFGYLYSNCSVADCKIKLIDCVLDKLTSDSEDLYLRIEKFKPSIIGISSSSSNFTEVLKIIENIKKLDNNIIVILGGPHATVYSEEAFSHKGIDFLFMGEGEESFNKFILACENYDLKAFSEIPGLAYKDKEGNEYYNEIARIKDLDSLKIPDYDFINIERYIAKGYNYLAEKDRCAPIYCTRGCPYRCEFCSVPSITGTKIRKHSVKYIIEWIKYLYNEKNIKGFNIIDDNFTFDIEYAKSFCREMIKLNYNDIEINSPNGIRMQRGDKELWELMKKAGWKVLTVAPESGSKRVLEMMKKDINPDIVHGIVDDIKKAGLLVKGFFILGYPNERYEDLLKTEELIRKCNFTYLSVTYFQPMPGTPIYDKLCEKKEISPDTLPTYFKNNSPVTYLTSTLRDVDLSSFREKLLTLKNMD